MGIIRKLRDPSYRFSMFMWIVAVHSLTAGLGLIFLPSELFEKLGYSVVSERFFVYQGGVFHIVMCIGYAFAAIGREKYEGIVFLSITAKFSATVFLLMYSFFARWVWVVFFSGIGDFIMAVMIFVLYGSLKKANRMVKL